MALPTVTALVGSEAVEDGLIRSLLEFYVERGIDLQSTFVDLIGAELAFEVAANLFNEIWSQRVRIVREPQRKRSGTSVVGLRGGDLAVLEHCVDHHVAALLGTIRVV